MPALKDQILYHAERIAKSVGEVRDDWLAIGELYLRVEREWMERTGANVRPSGKRLGKIRAEAGVAPEELGLASNEVSAAVTLARYRPAVEIFLHYNASKVATPVQWVAEWKRWAVHIRATEGGGHFTKEVRDKYFPEIPPGGSGLALLFPSVKVNQDAIRKIVLLANKAEDQQGTPEGETFRAKAENMAENLGLTIEEARDQYEPEVSGKDQQEIIGKIHRKIVSLANKYPIGVFRAAALYMFENSHFTPAEVERTVRQLNSEEC